MRVDQDIINVHGDDSFGDHIFEDLVHHRLECRWAISETEEHH